VACFGTSAPPQLPPTTILSSFWTATARMPRSSGGENWYPHLPPVQASEAKVEELLSVHFWVRTEVASDYNLAIR